MLSDPLSLNGDEPVAWKPPLEQPPLDDLFHGIAHLEARLIPATSEEFDVCMAALINTLPSGDKDGLTWEARLKIYRPALEDLPPDLLELACMRAIKSEKFFPKVADLREKVAHEFKTRENMLARAKWLSANRTRAPERKKFEPEPEVDRLRATIARWEKHRESFFGLQLRRSANAAEVRLAEIEGRAPADWAVEQATRRTPAPISKPPAPPVEPPTIEGDFSRVDDSDEKLSEVVHQEEPPARSGEELEW